MLNDGNGRIDFLPIRTGRPEPAAWTVVGGLGSFLGLIVGYPNSEMKSFLPTSNEGRADASAIGTTFMGGRSRPRGPARRR